MHTRMYQCSYMCIKALSFSFFLFLSVSSNSLSFSLTHTRTCELRATEPWGCSIMQCQNSPLYLKGKQRDEVNLRVYHYFRHLQESVCPCAAEIFQVQHLWAFSLEYRAELWDCFLPEEHAHARWHTAAFSPLVYLYWIKNHKCRFSALIWISNSIYK
jgi:hypothetical protein